MFSKGPGPSPRGFYQGTTRRILILDFILFWDGIDKIKHGFKVFLERNWEKLKKLETVVGSVVEWLKRWARDQHGLGSKPNCAFLLCPWERHFTAHSPAWWSWQAVLNYSHISIKLQADSNILVSPEAGRGNCLPYILAPPSLVPIYHLTSIRTICLP